MDIRHLQWLMGKLRFRWRDLITSQQELCALLGKVLSPEDCLPRGTYSLCYRLLAASLCPRPIHPVWSLALGCLGPRPGWELTRWALPCSGPEPEPRASDGPGGVLGQVELGIP